MNRIWCVLLALACLGCTDKEQEAVMESTTPLRTVCFGRHEISLPQDFRLESVASSATFYYGHDADFELVEFRVVDEQLEPQAFLDSVARRAAEIAGEVNEKTKGSMLLAHEELGDDAVLLRYHRSDISDRSHVHEVHRLVSGAHVFLKADSFNGVIEPVEARLAQLAASASAVPASGSAGSGFCLGSVVLDSGNDYEVAAVSYRDSGARHRDVTVQIELSTFKRDEAEPRLVQRLDGNFAGLGFKPKTLKKGAAQLAGMQAEQWLGRERVDGRVEHVFVIESYPPSPGLQHPGLQVNLETGGALPRQPASGLPAYRRPASNVAAEGERQGSSLTDDEAMALWEAIAGSVRPR